MMVLFDVLKMVLFDVFKCLIRGINELKLILI